MKKLFILVLLIVIIFVSFKFCGNYTASNLELKKATSIVEEYEKFCNNPANFNEKTIERYYNMAKEAFTELSWSLDESDLNFSQKSKIENKVKDLSNRFSIATGTFYINKLEHLISEYKQTSNTGKLQKLTEDIENVKNYLNHSLDYITDEQKVKIKNLNAEIKKLKK